MSEKLNMLIVDDDRSTWRLCGKILKGNPGFRIEQARNTKAALKKIEKSVPDIILCNHHLTDMESIDFFRLLKVDPDSDLSNIYVISLGPKDADEEKIRCIEAGADDYLTKPIIPDEFLARIQVGKRISLRLKKTQIENKKMFQEIDVLLIQEGGCAPGYNPVTAFITYHLEAQGRKIYATREGFKSLIRGEDNDFVRLVYNPDLFKKLDHIPGVFHAAPLSEWRGAQLRSERFREFLKPEIQEKAAAAIKKKNVKAIITIGGNGTFRGIHSLCDMIPTSIQVFFIPVTIDSDVAGTDCIGQYTGVESGAEKIRCYMADARAHKRTYVVEMMGASSGFHALHSCLGSRAHLAVLPNSVVDHKKVVEAINQKDECVIVVAEGYQKEARKAKGSKDNAAEYFYKELLATGIKIKRRVVCEPFSRDIRGAAPNNMDVSLAQRMAYNVACYLKAGTSRLMPAVQSGKEYAIPFHKFRPTT